MEHTLDLLLHPQRLARLIEHKARDNKRLALSELFDALFNAIHSKRFSKPYLQELNRVAEKSLMHHLLNLAGDKEINQQVSAHALRSLKKFDEKLANDPAIGDEDQLAHYAYLIEQLNRFKANPDTFKVPAGPAMPDGAPIGCDWE